MEIKRELLFKILVLGDFGVGKTSIVKRYAEDTFSPVYKITIGADFALKRIEWDEQTRINLQLWDIAGHERFGTLMSVYYRYALGAAVVYDLTRPATFLSIEKWISDLREKISLSNGKDLPIILLANKGDVTTKGVDECALNEFCKKHNIIAWMITSAKSNINLDLAMHKLLEVILANLNSSKEEPTIKNLEENVKPVKEFCRIL